MEFNAGQPPLPALLPRCARFSPDDCEVILEFLLPRTAGQPIDGNLLPDVEESELPTVIYPEDGQESELPSAYFKPNEYWFFLSKTPVTRKGLPASRCVFGSDENHRGKWKFGKTFSKIKDGNGLVVGYKRINKLLGMNNLYIGWKMVEFSRTDYAFEPLVVAHLFSSGPPELHHGPDQGVANNLPPLIDAPAYAVQAPDLLPKCLRFAPDDCEVILKFLLPKKDGQVIQGSLISDIEESQLPNVINGGNEYRSLYCKPNEYWFFITKTPVMRKGKPAERTVFGTDVTPQGKWKFGKTSKIKIGDGLVVGYKRTGQLIGMDKLATGWKMVEFFRSDNAFQDIVVGHFSLSGQQQHHHGDDQRLGANTQPLLIGGPAHGANNQDAQPTGGAAPTVTQDDAATNSSSDTDAFVSTLIVSPTDN